MHRISRFQIGKVPLACWIAAGMLAIAAGPAHATYTVIEDDLLPEAVIAARNAPPAPTVPDRFAVAFPKLQTTLGPLGMANLDMLVPNLKGSSIRIVGRGDAMPYTGTDKPAQLARYRAINIKNYLVKKGVPESSITVDSDNSPNPQPIGANYPSDIYVTRSEARPATSPVYTESRYSNDVMPQRQAAVGGYTTSQPGAGLPAVLMPQPASVQPSYTPPPATNTNESDQLIQFINQAVGSGKMHPTVALQLIRTLLASDTGRLAPASPAPAAPAQYFTAQPAISVAPKPVWALNKAVGVRENIDAWSKTAGWNPSSWEATNNYRIGRSSPDSVEGDFPDVLRLLADSSGLNICALKRAKYVRVTDPNVPCDKN